jgi:outer membrane protein TolC
LSLARAERASAEAQLIRARQAVAEGKAALAAWLAIDPRTLTVTTGKLLALSPEAPTEMALDNHPIAREQGAAISESQARLRVLDRSYFPHFAVQGTSYARGTGAMPDGRLLGSVNGLGPNIQNWGVGFTATFPLFELPSIRARRNAENAQVDAERGRLDQVLVELKSQQGKALAAYEGARQVAATMPATIEAARAAVEQARARYRSGLGTALEVADAQRRLAQAEIDDSLARLNTWRARLAWYAAQGDIAPLLAEASQ